MEGFSGALNSVAFSDSISTGTLPNQNHITYDGLFNQLQFQVGKQATQLIQIAQIHGKHQQTSQKFIALFIKSSLDGKPRHTNLNAVLVLDISGSMGGKLSNKDESKLNRLQLSKIATKKFVEKLKNQDSFSIVTFNNSAKTLFPLTKKGDMNIEAIFGIIDQISLGGGTTLAAGFNQGEKNFIQFREKCSQVQGEQRIVMLTDVCDNMGGYDFVSNLEKSGIHTTIIGISNEFRSETCQKLKGTKGFNYFCAIENKDLDIYLVDHFDYTFFPSVYDLELKLKSDFVNSFEVYGTPDCDQVNNYNNFANVHLKEFVITKMKSLFPSALQKNAKNDVIMNGGLILLKMKVKDVLPFIGTVAYRYKDSIGKEYQGQVNLQTNFEVSQDESFRNAIGGYSFVRSMKEIISRMHSNQFKISDQNKMQYLQELKKLQKWCPKCKGKDLQNMMKLVQEYKS